MTFPTPPKKNYPHPQYKGGYSVPFALPDALEGTLHTARIKHTRTNYSEHFYASNNGGPSVLEIVKDTGQRGEQPVVVYQWIQEPLDVLPLSRSFTADWHTGRITQLRCESGLANVSEVIMTYTLDDQGRNVPSRVETLGTRGSEVFKDVTSFRPEENFSEEQLKHFTEMMEMVGNLQGNGFVPANVPALKK